MIPRDRSFSWTLGPIPLITVRSSAVREDAGGPGDPSLRFEYRIRELAAGQVMLERVVDPVLRVQ